MTTACQHSPTESEPIVFPGKLQRGMTFVCWWQDCYGTVSADSSLRNLTTTGAEWISLIPTWYQQNKNSNTISRNIKTPSDAVLIHAISEAQASGLKIMLKPHIDVLDGSWRGEINPDNLNDWFNEYEKFILHYAAIAENFGIEQFCIGTEFKALSHQTAKWRALIQTVRGLFSGTLLYAANWDEYTQIKFWPTLDAVGIDAFFPLTTTNTPTLNQLQDGWSFWLDQIEDWVRSVNKPIYFTEVGFTSRDGTNTRPYDFLLPTKIDLQEQQLCYQATLIKLQERPWLKSIFWWMWRTDLQGGEQNLDYTPFMKPAENTLKEFWGRISVTGF